MFEGYLILDKEFKTKFFRFKILCYGTLVFENKCIMQQNNND